MTQDEIIEMANEAELCQCIWIDDEGPEIASLVAFAKLVRNDYSYKHAQLWLKRIEAAVKAEREACAKVCETEWLYHEEERAGKEFAKAIRARAQAERGEA